MLDGAPDHSQATYRFGPRDRRGVFAGLRAGQIGTAGAALVLGLAVLRSVGGVPGAALALVALAAGLLGCVLRVGGRSLDEWAPCAVGFAARRVGTSVAVAHRAHRGGRPPRAFAGLEVTELGAFAGRPLGAIRDRRRGTATAVLELRADGFALLAAAERARLVAAWSGLLAAMAMQAGALDRLSWIERTMPEHIEQLRHPLAAGPSDAARSYEALLAAETPGLQRHELLLACTLGIGALERPSRGRSRRWLADGQSAAGGEAGTPPTAAGRLAGEIERLSSRCQAAGIVVERALDPAELARVVGSSTALDGAAGRSGRWPWPLGVSEEWGCLRTDGTWHATYWIAEWPRSEVAGDFLLPLLVGSWARRSVALVMAPRPAQRAVRAAEQARTEKAADAELRRRHGFALTARLQREQEAVERREHELAAGHVAYRFSGYVTVTAGDPSALADACRSVEQAAALARLELRRLYGSQAEAFCCTLPTGRGCQ